MALNRVAILGTGLIGSSVGLAIKAAKPTTFHLVFSHEKDES